MGDSPAVQGIPRLVNCEQHPLGADIERLVVFPHVKEGVLDDGELEDVLSVAGGVRGDGVDSGGVEERVWVGGFFCQRGGKSVTV